MYYQHAKLDPRRGPDADAFNHTILSHPCLGIEVTVPALAERCSLGNIDPQHAGSRVDTTACEIVWRSLPELYARTPQGTTIVTVRPDADAAVSAALLELFAGKEPFLQINFQVAKARTAYVSRMDRHQRGPWAPSELPKIDDVGSRDFEFSALNGHVAKVLWVRAIRDTMDWLKTGRYEGREEALATAKGDYLSMVRALPPYGETQIVPGDYVTYVQSEHRLGTQLGYCYSPVVVVEAMNFQRDPTVPAHRKITIAQYAPGHADLMAVWRELSVLEPGWGGGPVIGGSPQNVDCVTPTEEILAVVKAKTFV